MRVFLAIAAAAITLSACNNAGETNTADLNATDPNAANMMMTDDNAAMANGAGGMDMNTATNAATENAMSTDLNTDDQDTNLANGM